MMMPRVVIQWSLIVLVALGIGYVAYDEQYNRPLIKDTRTFISQTGCFAMEIPKEWIPIELPTGVDSNGIESKIHFATQKTIDSKNNLLEQCKKKATRSRECRISQFEGDLFFSRYTGIRALPFGGIKRTIQFGEQEWYRHGPLNTFFFSGLYVPNVTYFTFHPVRGDKYVFEFHKRDEGSMKQYLTTLRFLSDGLCSESITDDSA